MTSILIAVIYRPPGIDRDLSALDSAFQTLEVCHSVLIAGDVNMDLSDSESMAAMELKA